MNPLIIGAVVLAGAAAADAVGGPAWNPGGGGACGYDSFGRRRRQVRRSGRRGGRRRGTQVQQLREELAECEEALERSGGDGDFGAKKAWNPGGGGACGYDNFGADIAPRGAFPSQWKTLKDEEARKRAWTSRTVRASDPDSAAWIAAQDLARDLYRKAATAQRYQADYARQRADAAARREGFGALRRHHPRWSKAYREAHDNYPHRVAVRKLQEAAQALKTRTVAVYPEPAGAGFYKVHFIARRRLMDDFGGADASYYERQGERAYLNGKTRGSNPHAWGSWQAQAWDDGWHTGSRAWTDEALYYAGLNGFDGSPRGTTR